MNSVDSTQLLECFLREGLTEVLNRRVGSSYTDDELESMKYDIEYFLNLILDN